MVLANSLVGVGIIANILPDINILVHSDIIGSVIVDFADNNNGLVDIYSMDRFDIVII